MRELVPVEDYPDFPSASRRAKELAIRFKKHTSIQRTDAGWVVLVSNTVSAALRPSVEEETTDYEFEDYSSNSYEDEYQREVVQPLIEEIQSDQDSWARSDEEGWFYED
jgi:hypothetical protein